MFLKITNRLYSSEDLQLRSNDAQEPEMPPLPGFGGNCHGPSSLKLRPLPYGERTTVNPIIKLPGAREGGVCSRLRTPYDRPICEPGVFRMLRSISRFLWLEFISVMAVPAAFSQAVNFTYSSVANVSTLRADFTSDGREDFVVQNHNGCPQFGLVLSTGDGEPVSTRRRTPEVVRLPLAISTATAIPT